MSAETERPPGIDTAVPLHGLESRAWLLDLSVARMADSVQAVVLIGIPFVVWLYHLGLDARGLLAWNLVYLLAAVVVRWQARRYARTRQVRTDEALLRRWTRVVEATALVHGAGVSVSVWQVAGGAPYELVMLLYATIAAIMAGNATHQTALFGVFQRFFFSGWSLSLAMLPWALPSAWPYGMALGVLYGATLYRHARMTHQFLLRQVALETQSRELADRYRAARDEATQALQERNRFLATASHDLRQPVHAMGFLVESIALRNRESALNPLLDDLRSSVRSVHQMFGSLLDLSKIDGGSVRIEPSRIELRPLLRDVATLFRADAQRRGLSLRVWLPRGEAEPAALADATLLRQCLVNFAENALRYTRQGGLLISARRRGAEWLLEVWDTGMGVEATEQNRIYAPFYRANYAWRADDAGHGLGLAVVARCATLMRATYGVQSTPGRGSRFWLRVPASSAPVKPKPPDAGAAGPSKARSVLRGPCLVIDDEPQVRDAWRALMQAWGVDVRCAESGAQAWSMVEAGFTPQAVLCDQRLRSGESGFEVLQALLERFPGASSAMVSGEFDSPELAQAEREGYLVLRKPVDSARLHQLLARWLSVAPAAQSMAPASALDHQPPP